MRCTRSGRIESGENNETTTQPEWQTETGKDCDRWKPNKDRTTYKRTSTKLERPRHINIARRLTRKNIFKTLNTYKQMAVVTIKMITTLDTHTWLQLYCHDYTFFRTCYRKWSSAFWSHRFQFQNHQKIDAFLERLSSLKPESKTF